MATSNTGGGALANDVTTRFPALSYLHLPAHVRLLASVTPKTESVASQRGAT